eukprot:m.33410 g.33410  ORF g.33410 m.33410 type:complete len:779 (-) comp5614_c0_seq2:49-2385(-)
MAEAAVVSKVASSYRQTNLSVRISEAKNLPAKDVNGLSDPYVIVVVDDERIARTSTVWKTLDPFFGEEFVLDLANNFEDVTLGIYDMDRITKDDPIGYVSFPRAALETDPSLAQETWYPLTKHTRESDLQGEVLVKLTKTRNATGLDLLRVSVQRARDIVPRHSTQKLAAFAIVELDMARQQTQRCKNNNFPQWSEEFEFVRAKLGPTVRVELRDTKGIGTSNFMGEAVISLNQLDYDAPVSAWYRLKPRAKDLEGLDEGYGSIRVALKYNHDLILPLTAYTKLIDFMESSSRSQEQIETGPIAILEDILADREQALSDREMVARTLVRILLTRNRCVGVLKMLNGLEISKSTEPSTLFRGNSMATKATDQFMKIVGIKYLHSVLKPIIDKVFAEKLDCEIDPAKLTGRKSDPLRNASNLIMYLQRLYDAIFQSVEDCPRVMRIVFKHLRENVAMNANLSGEGSSVQYTVVSGFLFLRFFAPAVLSPKLFGMRDDLADARTSRTLTLLAKALQSTSNLGSTIDGGKESYMEPLFPTIRDNLQNARSFIDAICDISAFESEDAELEDERAAQSVLHEGSFQTRLESASSFRKRTVRLTTSCIIVSKPKDLSSRIVVSLEKATAVEPTDIGAFGKKNVIKVESVGMEPLYILFSNFALMDSWLHTIRAACKTCASRIKSEFHPGILKRGKWTCCLAEDAEAPPCSKAHTTTVVDRFADSASANFWAHRMFDMLNTAKPRLEEKFLIASDPDPSIRAKQAACTILCEILDEINLQFLLENK